MLTCFLKKKEVKEAERIMNYDNDTWNLTFALFREVQGEFYLFFLLTEQMINCQQKNKKKRTNRTEKEEGEKVYIGDEKEQLSSYDTEASHSNIQLKNIS
jgi:hypothetical protein